MPTNWEVIEQLIRAALVLGLENGPLGMAMQGVPSPAVRGLGTTTNSRGRHQARGCRGSGLNHPGFGVFTSRADEVEKRPS